MFLFRAKVFDLYVMIYYKIKNYRYDYSSPNGHGPTEKFLGIRRANPALLLFMLTCYLCLIN